MQHEPVQLIFKAIVERQAVSVVYNGQTIELHPHQVFMRHGDVFVRALNPNKGRRHDEEPALGEFKLAGLKSIEPAGATFEPLASFTPF